MERDSTVTAMDLAVRAAEDALRLAPGLRPRIQQVVMINVLSGAPRAAASVLSDRLGLAPRQVEVTTVGGNSPQWAVTRAASAVAAGDIDAVLVVGAEAQRSQRAARGQGNRHQGSATQKSDDGDADRPADLTVGDERMGVGQEELDAGLIVPVHVYALFESVLAHRAGRSFAEQRLALGALMAPFTEVAAAHPYAWFPQRRRPGELSELTPDNRLVTEPYPKRMCAVLGVDQGAAVVVSSLGAARAAGVAEQVIFCVAGADANDVWYPSARPDPGRSPGIAAAGSAAFTAAGIGVDDLVAIDLYSCFPCAVQMGGAALGLDPSDRRGLTVTGGLPYFGGPGNNYTLHAIATMAGLLLDHRGIGLVTGLGWYATKHAVGIYSSAPPARGWQRGDTGVAQTAIDATAVELAHPGVEGAATVVASTVVVGPNGEAASVPAILRLPDGRHLPATAAADDVPALAGRNLVGKDVLLCGPGPRFRVLG
jgi:acetyl-CoA C-acetyltransferase